MKTKLVIAFLSILFTGNHVYGQEKMSQSIVSTIQKEMKNIPFIAYSFCIPELVSVLEQDSLFLYKLNENISDHLNYVKQHKDVYYTNIMQIHFFKDSLINYNSQYDKQEIYKLIDLLNGTYIYQLKESDMHLFFESYTSESGIGALKIEVLISTQNLDFVFNYIESNENAKQRFIKWINEEIEVWTPSFGTMNTEWDDRIIYFLKNRLKQVKGELPKLALEKMNSWFDL